MRDKNVVHAPKHKRIEPEWVGGWMPSIRAVTRLSGRGNRRNPWVFRFGRPRASQLQGIIGSLDPSGRLGVMVALSYGLRWRRTPVSVSKKNGRRFFFFVLG